MQRAVLVQPGSYLDHRVQTLGLVAAPGAPGVVEAEVLAETVPHVLSGQWHAKSQGEHDQEHHRLHGDRPAGELDGSREASGGGRYSLLRGTGLVGSIIG